MIKLDFSPSEFLELYELLSMQQLESGEKVLLPLKNKMKNVLLGLLMEREKPIFQRWERQQREKIAEIK